MNRKQFEKLEKILSWTLTIICLAIGILCLVTFPSRSWTIWAPLLIVGIIVCPRFHFPASVRFAVVAIAYLALFVI